MTTKLLPSRSGNLGIFELNNSATLNSLDLDMVRSINHVLPQWQSDATLRATLMIGRATLMIGRPGAKRPCFCAGGDVKTVYMSGKGLSGSQADEEAARTNQHGYGHRGLLTADFFREEYQMNHTLATQDHDNMPQVSIWDGVVMGGGVGLSLHGKYRVCTENTLFAKPETAIGLFPDVGGMWWLSRMKGGLGNYIALTGHRLKADDVLYAGLATHFVPSEKLEELKSALIAATISGDDLKGGDCVASTLMSFHDESDVNKNESFLAKNRAEIDQAFDGKEQKVEDILASLETMAACGSTFASKSLDTLSKMSPSSLKVTQEGIRRGSELPNIGEVLKMEYRMSQTFIKNHDFYEGIRAVLVDKDQNPKWIPDNLDNVTDQIVGSYFDDLGEHELELVPVKKMSKM
eukprot:CAMPEP_0181035584 /NCGR_PEP_ID=MMETSP1070-20121207/8399_1 /TAXON_ID=265543 /ORGANISM="Minutocellus polymorphus, Strain NH13" /LENGTH=405 /DNA_ID=CAMNT_0023113149 /DNA_START=31 /DNA_END=1248 /DNA_ORIENTATION=-